MATVLVILAILMAVVLTLTIFGLVLLSDVEGNTVLSREKGRLGLKSLYGYRYDETPEEKRKRLGAPARV